MRKTTAHLDPAAILVYNAKRIADAQSRSETYCGPQMTEHRKPNAGGGPCDVCGCLGIRLGVLHKALGFGHDSPRARFIVFAKDYTGDWSERCLTYEGTGC